MVWSGGPTYGRSGKRHAIRCLGRAIGRRLQGHQSSLAFAKGREYIWLIRVVVGVCGVIDLACTLEATLVRVAVGTVAEEALVCVA
jgi:hypothetical protein